MLTPHEAYRRVIKNDPTFIVKNGVDYDKQYYVFTGPLDMYAVDKHLGTVVGFVPTTNMEKYFDAVKNRSLDIGSFQHSDNDELYLEHHGIKGQRWGVRRFQNPDGTLNEEGRKRYKKKIGIEERKVESLRAFQGRIERVKTPLSIGWAIAGAVSGALVGVPAGPAGIAAGAAIVSAISGGSTYLHYTTWSGFAEIEEGMRKKKIAKYKDLLKQDAFIVEDGTLYLEHFGIKNMKCGVRRFQNKDGSLTEAGKKRYGSGEELSSGGGGGGGAPEEDEEMKKKIEEAAKKAGMTVDEYRKKMGSKLYDLFGGKYKKEAEDLRKRQLESSKNARLLEKEGGKKNEDANSERVNAKVYGHYAKEANKSYEKSIAGRYDKLKATMAEHGKAKRSSQIPTKNSSPDQSPTNRPVSREKTKSAVKGSIKAGERRHRSTTSQRGIKQGEKHEGLRTHTLPKMKSLTATAKPMRKLTSKELSKIRSEAKKRRK